MIDHMDLATNSVAPSRRINKLNFWFVRVRRQESYC